MLNIDIFKPAERFLRKLQQKQQKQITRKILSIANNPTPSDSKLLKGFLGCYRTDVGEYRIIYKFSSIVLYVLLIGKRNDDEVYRKFKRLL